MLRCRYRSAQEVQQRFSRKYQDSSAGRKSRSGSGSRSRSRCGRGAGAEVVLVSRGGGEVVAFGMTIASLCHLLEEVVMGS